MKHKTFIIALLTVILSGLVGCSNASTIGQNSNDSMPITGYWVYQEAGESDYFHFDGDGSGFEAVIYEGHYLGSADYSYSVDDDRVRIAANGEAMYWNVIDVNDSDLLIEIGGSQYRLSKVSEQSYNNAVSSADSANYGGGYSDPNQWAAEESMRQAEQAAQNAQQAAEQAGQQAMQAAGQPMF